MQITRDSKCPRCGSHMTSFVDSYSDGDEIVPCSLNRQLCANSKCGLPVKFWDEWAEMELLIKELGPLNAP